MKVWRAEFPMDPVGKGRPRTVRTKNGRHVTYTPDPTAHAENLIRDRVMNSDVYYEKGVPLLLHIHLVIRRPKSAPKKRKHPVVKPDDDNCEKLVRDALNKYLYYDDCQIVRKVVVKSYGERPCIRIRVREVA